MSTPDHGCASEAGPVSRAAEAFVLVHGGQHTSGCWDLLRPHLGLDSVAVDLPGRPGATVHPKVPRIADYVAAIIEGIDAVHGPIVLVGHSASGPAVAMAAGQRPEKVSRVIFIASLLPESGTDGLESMPRPLRSLIRRRSQRPRTVQLLGDRGLRARIARYLLCHDMDEATTQRALDGLVPETTLVREPFVYPDEFWALPRTYIALTRDRVVGSKQVQVVTDRLQPVESLTIDAGHNVMLSQPVVLAELLNQRTVLATPHG